MRGAVGEVLRGAAAWGCWAIIRRLCWGAIAQGSLLSRAAKWVLGRGCGGCSCEAAGQFLRRVAGNLLCVKLLGVLSQGYWTSFARFLCAEALLKCHECFLCQASSSSVMLQAPGRWLSVHPMERIRK